jgi:hypothetical protein
MKYTEYFLVGFVVPVSDNRGRWRGSRALCAKVATPTKLT